MDERKKMKKTKTGARTTKNKPKKLSFVQSEDMTGEVENQIGVKFEDGVVLRENCYIIWTITCCFLCVFLFFVFFSGVRVVLL